MITTSILLASQNKSIGIIIAELYFSTCGLVLSVTRPSAFTDPNQNKAIPITPGPYCKDNRCDVDLIQNTSQAISQYEDTLCIVGSACQTMILCHICPKGGWPSDGESPYQHVAPWHHVVMTPTHQISFLQDFTNGIILYLVDSAWLGIFQRIKIRPTKLLSQLRHNKLHISFTPSMSHWCLIDGYTNNTQWSHLKSITKIN